MQNEAKKTVKNVEFRKVDTEKYPVLSTKYKVQALPTLVLFKKGKEIGRMEGVLNAADLQRWIDQTVRTKV